MLGVVCQLRFIASVKVAFENVERAVFFTEVIERLVVITPNRVAVFSVE